eukprot:TRINITY_DN60894_c0_g1_i1.p2 TRINITY_DN60894_c0_g1~~TRINITY_DN60894_c0_g1_i1.p2  ORF type:complete len:126 (+),score=19.44 TRINITY_DN60894_c0_g1_i1:297-674(+)
MEELNQRRMFLGAVQQEMLEHPSVTRAKQVPDVASFCKHVCQKVVIEMSRRCMVSLWGRPRRGEPRRGHKVRKKFLLKRVLQRTKRHRSRSTTSERVRFQVVLVAVPREGGLPVLSADGCGASTH